MDTSTWRAVGTRAARRIGWMLLGATLLLTLEFLLGGCGCESQADVARQSLRRLHEKDVVFQIKHKRAPASLHELYADGAEPTDPWGSPFVMRCTAPDAPCDFGTLGADARLGGTGADADLGLADLHL